MQDKTILVVGGAGYIGSHVNKSLHNEGFKTVVFDNLSRGDRSTIIHGDFVKGDTSSPENLNRVFASYKIDAVMHFAAHIAVGESVVNPSKYYHNNVSNTLNLLDAMIENNVRKLIFSSTAAIFGIPQEVPVNEAHPCAPINPYGHSKLMVEKILQDFDHAYGLKSCCLRYFNAAGGDPEGELKQPAKSENNLIPIALRSLLEKNGGLTIFGDDYDTSDGTCVRDYIHVHDLATAHISALKQLLNGAVSSAYNLGNGQGFSVKEVLNSVEKVTGQSLSASVGSRREGDPPVLLADSSKAQKELNWQPEFADLDSIVGHAWNAMN